MFLDCAYKIALAMLIGVTAWAVLSSKVKDKAHMVVALCLVNFASIAMLTQSFTNFYASVHATKLFVIGASIFEVRCFYIKFLKAKVKRYIRSKKADD